MHQSIHSGSIARAAVMPPQSRGSHPNWRMISEAWPFAPVAAQEHGGNALLVVGVYHLSAAYAIEGLSRHGCAELWLEVVRRKTHSGPW